MSSYISFFIRAGEELYVPLIDFSRNTKAYEICSQRVPYGKARAISIADIKDFIERANDEKEDYRSTIVNHEWVCDQLLKSNNDINDKIDRMTEERSFIDECMKSIEEVECAVHFLRLLIQIIDSRKPCEWCDDNSYIYAGIEVGYSITKGDIV